MAVKIFRLDSGFYAVMVWDDSRNDWSLWWSGGRSAEDAARECDRLLRGGE